MTATKEPSSVKEIDKEIMGLRKAMEGGPTAKNKHVYERVSHLIELRDELHQKETKTGRYDPLYLVIKPMLNPKIAKMATKRVIVDTEEEAEKIAKALVHYLGGYESRKLPDGRIEIGSLGYYYYIGPT